MVACQYFLYSLSLTVFLPFPIWCTVQRSVCARCTNAFLHMNVVLQVKQDTYILL